MSTTAEDLANLDPAFLDEHSEEYESLMNPSGDMGTTPEQDVESASSGAEAEQPTPSDETEQQEAAEAAEEVMPEGVLSPDGKHIIPYKELKNTRQQVSDERKAREEAEERARELQQEIEALKSGQTTETQDPSTTATNATREKLESLKEDFPELGEFLESQQQTIDTLTMQRQQDELSRQEEAARVAREAIDNNPTLSLWENEDKAAYQRAIDHDARLAQDPVWRDRPLSERFETVVALTRTEYPDAKVPTSAQPRESEDLKGKAKAALENADEPDSLSHIPGGSPPSSARDVDSLSELQLEAMFESMSEEDVNAFLSKHA